MPTDDQKDQIEAVLGKRPDNQWTELPNGVEMRAVRGGLAFRLTKAEKAFRMKIPTRGGVVSHRDTSS